jgi:hypothetical protein
MLNDAARCVPPYGRVLGHQPATIQGKRHPNVGECNTQSGFIYRGCSNTRGANVYADREIVHGWALCIGHQYAR